MSDNAAAVGASETIRNPKIANALAIRKKQLQLLNPVCTVEELCESWSNEIRFDLSELVGEDGQFLPPDKLSPMARKVLQGVKVKEDVVALDDETTALNRKLEYTLPDRQKAKVELGKRIGFYPDPKVGLNFNLDEQSAGLVAAALDKLAAQLPRDDLVKK